MHSSIEDAHTCIEIAMQAPVFTEADYEACLEMLEEAHSRLRGVFVGGQEPGVPTEWRIDGLVYREVDRQLVGAKTKLLQRYRASKFFAGQRRMDKRRKADKEALDTKWLDIGGMQEITVKDKAGNVHNRRENTGEELAMSLKRQGFDVQRTTGGQWQYASRKEIPKSKTSV